MRLTIRSARPVILLAMIGIAGALMLTGLIRLGTAEVVPIWFQAAIGAGGAFFWRDRRLAHTTGETDVVQHEAVVALEKSSVMGNQAH